jgi:hypothetical protein
MKNQTLWVCLTIIIATVSNAIADQLMLKMIAENMTPGSILNILEWTSLQWYWHICKWIFFNGALGSLSTMLIGWKKTFLLSIGCLILWEFTYDMVSKWLQ